jgi:hypothetical protein
MPREDQGGPVPPKPALGREDGHEQPPIPGPALAIFFAALAVALVLGYLFVNKLADISRDEECALARRHNCAPIELRNR